MLTGTPIFQTIHCYSSVLKGNTLFTETQMS